MCLRVELRLCRAWADDICPQCASQSKQRFVAGAVILVNAPKLYFLYELFSAGKDMLYAQPRCRVAGQPG